MSGILKLGGTTLGTENNGTIDLEFHSTSQDFTLKAVDAPIGEGTSVQNLDSGQLAIYNGDTKLWGINESGWVQNPNVPAFYAYLISNPNLNGYVSYGNLTVNSIGLGVSALEIIKYLHTHVNIGGNYSTATGRFTAPIDGTYKFNAQMLFDNTQTNSASSGFIEFLINGGKYNGSEQYTGTQYTSLHSTLIVTLNAGDYVEKYANGGMHHRYSSFSGYLIG